MPDFTYKAKDGPGRKVTGVVEASSQSVAIEKIHEMGYAPISVHVSDHKHENLRKLSSWIGPRISKDKQLMIFSRYLSGFLKNKVDVLVALSIMEKQENNLMMRKILKGLHQGLKSGKSLSLSMEEYSDFFPKVYRAMIKAGETGSALQQTFDILSRFLRKSERTKTVVKQALTYPLFLLAAGVVAIVFILSFVVPKITALLTSFNQELPQMTQWVINIGSFMKWGWPVVILILAFVVFMLPGRVKSRIGVNSWDAMRSRFPMVGELVVKSEYSRFCQALRMSLVNGIPFLKSLEVAIPVISFSHIQEGLRRASKDVQEGRFFGQGLRSTTLFPVFMTDLIEVGEKSGNLEDVLQEIADVYEEEVDDKIKLVTTLLEPLMILIIGGVVGFIVIAMLLPIFDMNIMY